MESTDRRFSPDWRSASNRLELQAGLIDTADPQLPGSPPNMSTISRAERSRWPGTEARIASAWGDPDLGPEVGVSGYFSPHETGRRSRFDAWAGAMDLRLPMTRHFHSWRMHIVVLASAALAVEDTSIMSISMPARREIARALDDVGGWTQLKSKIGERLELNGGYGIDNPFAGQIHTSTAIPEYAIYPGLARNRSAFGNVIYSPSSYLLFSLEYRRLVDQLCHRAGKLQRRDRHRRGVSVLMQCAGSARALCRWHWRLYRRCSGPIAVACGRSAGAVVPLTPLKLATLSGHLAGAGSAHLGRAVVPGKIYTAAEEQDVHTASAGCAGRQQRRISKRRSFLSQRLLIIRRQTVRSGTV